MDLDALAARYEGEARLERLLCVASVAASRSASASGSGDVAGNAAAAAASSSNNTATATATTAYRMVAQFLQQAGNTHKYKQIFFGNTAADNSNAATATATTSVDSMVRAAAVPSYNVAWVHETELANQQSRDVLHSRLALAQSHLQKDAIRTAYLALAEFDLRVGDLTEAFHSVLRAKDYCTNRQQTAAVTLMIVQVSLYLKNYASVREYVTKLEHTLGATAAAGTTSATSTTTAGAGSGETSTSASSSGATASTALLADVKNKLLVASALEALFSGDYHKAAAKLSTAVKSGSTTWDWPAVLAPEEAALYAGILALAVSSREEMVALAEHPEAPLELVPRLRECLIQFGRRANYKTCWQILQESVFDVLAHDLYMSHHLTALQQLIRQKSILLYWQAYQRVELSVMAAELGPGLVPSQDFLLDTMVQLIGNGSCGPDTRIDLQERVLVREEQCSSPEEARFQATQSKLTTLTRHVVDDTYSMVIRLACLEHGLGVGDGSSSASGKRRGGGGGRLLFGGAAGMRGGVDSHMNVADFGGDEIEDSSDDDELDTPMIDAGDGMNPEDLY